MAPALDRRRRALRRRAGRDDLPSRGRHLHETAQRRAVRDDEHRRRDAADDRGARAHVHPLGCRQVSVEAAVHDHRGDGHVAHHAAARLEHQRSRLEADFALDAPCHREVLARRDVALDDDRCADVHHTSSCARSGKERTVSGTRANARVFKPHVGMRRNKVVTRLQMWRRGCDKIRANADERCHRGAAARRPRHRQPPGAASGSRGRLQRQTAPGCAQRHRQRAGRPDVARPSVALLQRD